MAEAGISAVAERLATSAAEAAAVASAMGDRLALKILSPDILHKTEAGGVLLDVPAAEAADAYDGLIAQFAQQHRRRASTECSSRQCCTTGWKQSQ